MGGDPDTMTDIDLWQMIVRCLHAARKKFGEHRHLTWLNMPRTAGMFETWWLSVICKLQPSEG